MPKIPVLERLRQEDEHGSKREITGSRKRTSQGQEKVMESGYGHRTIYAKMST